jgi:hypothetical protein
LKNYLRWDLKKASKWDSETWKNTLKRSNKADLVMMMSVRWRTSSC